jgi:hypothetical protein
VQLGGDVVPVPVGVLFHGLVMYFGKGGCPSVREGSMGVASRWMGCGSMKEET